MTKAIGLISGGLDSLLATLILREQGIDIIGVNFYTGFCIYEMQKRKGLPPSSDPMEIVRNAGVEVKMVDISTEFMEMVMKPEHGYGKFSNPCIDCRIMMLKKAKEIMREEKADFIFTGEVAGERPMTQQFRQLKLIEQQSSCKGILLRPLSAKILPPTEPEKRGIVDRSKLYGIKGRSRRIQLQLAKKFGLEKFPQPAGGCCFLTDETFARRFFDLKSHLNMDRLTQDEVSLLTTGRHFRLSEEVKLIVGRNEAENRLLEQFSDRFPIVKISTFQGPLGLIYGRPSEDEIKKAGGIILRYSKSKDKEVSVVDPEGKQEKINVTPMPPEEVEKFFI